MVLCFSPVGDAFRQRLRMFPSLVNCCTIDWFSEWPLEALKSVATSFCGEMALGQDQVRIPGCLYPAVWGRLRYLVSVRRVPGSIFDMGIPAFLRCNRHGVQEESQLEGVVGCCVALHQSVERASRKYHEELRRYNYVTPTSYLELLGTFMRQLGEKRTEISAARARLAGGLQKLAATAAQVLLRGVRGCVF